MAEVMPQGIALAALQKKLEVEVDDAQEPLQLQLPQRQSVQQQKQQISPTNPEKKIEFIDLSQYHDDDILDALLSMASVEQGEILAGWIHRLEQTGMHHTLHHQISRRCEGVSIKTVCGSTQTELHGPSHFGDTTTDQLADAVADLENCINVMVERLTKTAEDVSTVRGLSRDVHVAVFQTKGQSELAANVTRNVMSHQSRIEKRLSDVGGSEAAVNIGELAENDGGGTGDGESGEDSESQED